MKPTPTKKDWLPPKTTIKPVATAPSESPSGAGLLAEIEQVLHRYVILPPSAYLPVALWIFATYAVDRVDCFPYLALLSAVKRSGKTRLAEVIHTLARRALRGVAPSPAALYRMLEGAPTLLLDEVELFHGKNKSETTLILLAVLNAGHRKGATIPRCEGPRHDIRHFPVYGPKLFAAIGQLPDTLLDRSIVIHMKHRSKTQIANRFREARAKAEGMPIRENITRFVQNNRAAIDRAYEDVLEDDLEFLNDRDADLWTPLFVICAVTDPGRISELKSCALLKRAMTLMSLIL